MIESARARLQRLKPYRMIRPYDIGVSKYFLRALKAGIQPNYRQIFPLSINMIGRSLEIL